MSKVSKSNSGFSVVEVVLVIVTLVLVGAGGFFVAKHIDNAKQPAKGVAVKSTAPATSASTPAATAPVANQNVVKIPELGIEFTVPDAIKDVVYKVNPAGTLSTGEQTQSVTLSTTTLTNLDQGCSVTGNAPALGHVSRTSGQYPQNPSVVDGNASGGLIKQFPSYYIAFSSPQATCSDNATTSSTAAADLNLFTAALKSIQAIN